MAEYIKRDDALHVLDVFREQKHLNKIETQADLIHEHTAVVIENLCDSIAKGVSIIPAADVVEVVRCKDCKHYSPTYYSICTNNNVEISFYGESAVLVVEPDFYCAYGERRNKEDGQT